MKTRIVAMVSFILLILAFLHTEAQVGIGTTSPNPNSMLDITAVGKGLLIPRMTLSSRPAGSVPGLLYYQTDNTPGYYYYNSTNWVRLMPTTEAWGVQGNSGTISSVNFLGTSDNRSLSFRTNNTRRMVIDSLGNIGIGTTSPVSPLEINKTSNNSGIEEGLRIITNFNGSLPSGTSKKGIHVLSTWTPPSTVAGYNDGIQSFARTEGATSGTYQRAGTFVADHPGTGQLQENNGIWIQAYNGMFATTPGTGDIYYNRGILVVTSNNSQGTITQNCGILVSTPENPADGIITNNYGIYLTNQNVLNGGTDYSIYSVGGANLNAIGTTWANASDRNIKCNIVQVDRNDMLEKISALPITKWSYIGEENVSHVGPMAQDFYQVFGLGQDDKSISTIDPAGLSLVGVQELARRNKELEEKVEALVKRIEQLEKGRE